MRRGQQAKAAAQAGYGDNNEGILSLGIFHYGERVDKFSGQFPESAILPSDQNPVINDYAT